MVTKVVIICSTIYWKELFKPTPLAPFNYSATCESYLYKLMKP